MGSWITSQLIKNFILKELVTLLPNETVHTAKGDGIELDYIIRGNKIILLCERKL